METVKTVD